MIYTDESYIRNTLIPRKRDAHKGNFGKILIFAGSVGMAGAAVLCGRAALKSGAGLVQYLLPDFSSPLLSVLQTAVPEATCVAWNNVLALSSYTAIAAGSGLGKSPEAREILTQIIKTYHGILVLDADALNLIAEDPGLAELVRNAAAQIILTPHIGEARRLLHTDAPILDAESRKQAALELSRRYQSIAILKGAGTLIADAREQSPCGTAPKQQKTSEKKEGISGFCATPFLAQNTTGNPGMATAGSGDALAGLITSLAAQGYSSLDAARLGVYFHGLAGDLAAQELGEMGLTSSDIVSYIPYAIHQFL